MLSALQYREWRVNVVKVCDGGDVFTEGTLQRKELFIIAVKLSLFMQFLKDCSCSGFLPTLSATFALFARTREGLKFATY